MDDRVWNRRRFIAGGTGLLVASLWPRTVRSLQAAGAGTLPARVGPDWLPDSHLLQLLPRLLELAEVPGLALGVVERGQVWTRGFGRASLSPRSDVSVETVFEAVSLGKPLFAYAVLMLADAGLLDLDRPLYDYLPAPEADNPRGRSPSLMPSGRCSRST